MGQYFRFIFFIFCIIVVIIIYLLIIIIYLFTYFITSMIRREILKIKQIMSCFCQNSASHFSLILCFGMPQEGLGFIVVVTILDFTILPAKSRMSEFVISPTVLLLFCYKPHKYNV